MPERFGNYELLEPLATGGMARVYRARMIGALGFEKIVALKFMLPGFASEPDAVKMFIDEARLAATHSHANIVGILDFGQKDGEYYIAMEYVSGANLRVILRRAIETKRFPTPTMAARIIAEVALGLDYAHRKTDAQGNAQFIVHRDVSPQNIVVSWTGEVKILDFGIARSTNRSVQTTAGTIKGKYSYMSPEQARGDAVDGRSDLYALGAVFYEMLCGERAYPNPGLDALERVRRSEFVPIIERNPEVPAALAEAVTKAMASNPEDRYPSAGALVEVLALWLAEARVRGEKGGDAASVAAWAESLFSATTAESAAAPSSPAAVLSGWEPDNFSGKPADGSAPPSRRDLTFGGGDDSPESTTITPSPLESPPEIPSTTFPAAREEPLELATTRPSPPAPVAPPAKPEPRARPPASTPGRPDFAAVAEAIGKPLGPASPRRDAAQLANDLWKKSEEEDSGRRMAAISVIAAIVVISAGGLFVWARVNAGLASSPTPAPVAIRTATPAATAAVIPSEAFTAVAVNPTAIPEPTMIEPLTIDHSAKPIGLLDVASTPAGAQVSLNGSVLGESPVLIPNLLSPGSYVVEVRKEGYATWSREIDLIDDNAMKVVADLHVPDLPGRLVVPLPPSVSCYVDGKLAGTGPRRVSIDLQPGNHQVRLRDPKRTLLRAYEVLLSPGGTSELDVPPAL